MSQQETTIDAIHTPCKKCVFAQYENKTQTGCHLQYLDIYKQQNTEIIAAFDDDLEFNIINRKKCIGYRENSWFTQFGLENASIKDKLDKFNGLNHIDYFMIVNLDSEDINDQRISALSQEINGLHIKPQKIIFVRYRKNALKYDYAFIVDFLNSCGLDKTPWKIQTMEDDNALYEHTLHNIVTLNRTPRFVLSVRLHDQYGLSNIIDKANEIVYRKLERFFVVANTQKNCLLFSGLLYRFALLSEKKSILQDFDNYTTV